MNERLKVYYHMFESDLSLVESRSFGIALEQTVELPLGVVKNPWIKDEIIGHIESINSITENLYEVCISYHTLSIGDELLQLLNVVFGNSSIQKNLKVDRVEIPDHILKRFKGPRFGRQGLRELFKVHNKPLLCTALKPMGSSADELAELAYQFALGGVDIIKDDHGLANQSSSPFQERVEKCTAAVNKANKETGGNSIYAPNVTTSFDKFTDSIKFAKDVGAGALMISPAMMGYDTVRWLTENDSIALPILLHPTFGGPNVISPTVGFSYSFYYGVLSRLMGADAVVFPNFGGRFGFTKEECQQIINGSECSLGHIKQCFPCPGGGMTFDKISVMQEVYKDNVIYLMGGGLYSQDVKLSQAVKNLYLALGR